MAGAEGSGLLNGVTRVGPSLQPEQGRFDEHVLDGLDLVLSEMGKRDMKAVIFLSNNWEWSGGFQQYLIWNHVISDRWLTEKPSWDELRDNVAKFYTCQPYARLSQTGRLRHRPQTTTTQQPRYIDDPAIMAWELANEPRPMRPAANDAYLKWTSDTAAFIKGLDKRHLVTTGHEGSIGTESNVLFKSTHEDPNIDYLTIHIWPKNWGWFRPGQMVEDYPKLQEKTRDYLRGRTYY